MYVRMCVHIYLKLFMAKSAGAAEYTDFISFEG